MNTIWNVEPKKTGGIMTMIKDRFLSFAMVFGVGFLLLVSLVLDAAVAAAGKFVGDRLPGGEALWQGVQLVVSLAVITLLFALIFRFLPDIHPTWRDVWFGAIYTLFYVKFATHGWQYALLPFHFLMGPIHGAIVNWCGHKYGYRNFDNGDLSRNTLVFDFLTSGELFQNNHHKFGMSPDFAARWFEIDPTWQVMRVLAKAGVIEIATPQRAVYPATVPAAS